MGSIVVACYKPRRGAEEALLDLVRGHLPPLRSQGLVTDRAPIMMRGADGLIVEVFEWVSQEAIASAHTNPVVLDLWKKFEAVCWYETPANVAEFKNPSEASTRAIFSPPPLTEAAAPPHFPRPSRSPPPPDCQVKI